VNCRNGKTVGKVIGSNGRTKKYHNVKMEKNTIDRIELIECNSIANNRFHGKGEGSSEGTDVTCKARRQ